MNKPIKVEYIHGSRIETILTFRLTFDVGLKEATNYVGHMMTGKPLLLGSDCFKVDYERYNSQSFIKVTVPPKFSFNESEERLFEF